MRKAVSVASQPLVISKIICGETFLHWQEVCVLVNGWVFLLCLPFYMELVWQGLCQGEKKRGKQDSRTDTRPLEKCWVTLSDLNRRHSVLNLRVWILFLFLRTS